MKRLLFILIFLSAFGMQLIAQSALKVGDNCPDLTFEYFIKSDVKRQTLSAYNDKWVLLDFWATYCSGCVAGLKKLETLEELYGDRLVVMPVATQKDEQVIKFWNSNAITQSLGIGTILHNENLERLFPRRAVPHFVLINPERKIAAITYAEFVNESNIGKVLSDIPVRFADKTIENLVATDIGPANGKYWNFSREDLFGYSEISRFNPQVQTSTGQLKLDTIDGRIHCSINNNTLYEMYLKTVSTTYAKFSKLRIIEDIDSSLLFFNRKAGVYRVDWDLKNKYTYSISLLPGQSREKILNKIREDLNFYFGLNGRIEKRKLKVWNAKIDGGQIKANDVYNKNALTLGSIIDILCKWDSVPYIMFDDVSARNEIICDIEEFPGITCAEEIRIWLANVGIEVAESFDEVDCFVLGKGEI